MYTLKTLLETHPIVIPMIQRDYAQGRTSVHATRVRSSILPKLKQATLHDEQLDFDFIYGSFYPSPARWSTTPDDALSSVLVYRLPQRRHSEIS